MNVFTARSWVSWMLVVQLAVFGVLQQRLWQDDTSLLTAKKLQIAIADQMETNQQLAQRNDQLGRKVDALKLGGAAVEERARLDLGFIGKDETFFLITD